MADGLRPEDIGVDRARDAARSAVERLSIDQLIPGRGQTECPACGGRMEETAVVDPILKERIPADRCEECGRCFRQ